MIVLSHTEKNVNFDFAEGQSIKISKYMEVLMGAHVVIGILALNVRLAVPGWQRGARFAAGCVAGLGVYLVLRVPFS